jgi:hypothetical protein
MVVELRGDYAKGQIYFFGGVHSSCTVVVRERRQFPGFQSFREKRHSGEQLFEA